jgi:integrase
MPTISIATFESELMILYAPPRRARSTQRQVVQVLREFAAAGVGTTAELRAVTIARWMDAHPARSAATHKSHLRCLRAVISYALAEGYLERSPFAYRPVGSWIRDDVAPSKPRAPRHRSVEDVSRILSTASAEASGGRWEARRLEALVYTYAYLGLRAAEALHLWTADVNLAARSIRVQAHVEDGWKPKTLKSAAVLPIAEPLAAVLGRWLPHTGARWVFPGKRLRGPWLSGGPGVRPLDQVAELGRRAGVPGLTIASFRATIGTYAKSWGFSQLELKALLRHSHVETQKWYDEGAVDSLRGAAAKVRFGA